MYHRNHSHQTSRHGTKWINIPPLSRLSLFLPTPIPNPVYKSGLCCHEHAGTISPLISVWRTPRPPLPKVGIQVQARANLPRLTQDQRPIFSSYPLTPSPTPTPPENEQRQS